MTFRDGTSFMENFDPFVIAEPRVLVLALFFLVLAPIRHSKPVKERSRTHLTPFPVQLHTYNLSKPALMTSLSLPPSRRTLSSCRVDAAASDGPKPPPPF